MQYSRGGWQLVAFLADGSQDEPMICPYCRKTLEDCCTVASSGEITSSLNRSICSNSTLPSFYKEMRQFIPREFRTTASVWIEERVIEAMSQVVEKATLQTRLRLQPRRR